MAPAAGGMRLSRGNCWAERRDRVRSRPKRCRSCRAYFYSHVGAVADLRRSPERRRWPTRWPSRWMSAVWSDVPFIVLAMVPRAAARERACRPWTRLKQCRVVSRPLHAEGVGSGAVRSSLDGPRSGSIKRVASSKSSLRERQLFRERSEISSHCQFRGSNESGSPCPTVSRTI